MYEPPSENRPGCRDTAALTHAVFAILLPPLAAIFAVLVLLALALVCYAVHPALALLPIAALVAAIFLFARWEQRRYRPPDA